MGYGFVDRAMSVIKRKGGEIIRGSGAMSRWGLHGVWSFSCYDKDGALKWQEDKQNLVVRGGRGNNMAVYFSGTTQNSTWYVGLMTSAPNVADDDTMAAHAGWVETESYGEANRVTWTETRTGSTMTNSGSKASFAINGTTVVGGAFMVDENTKGGATGTMFSGVVLTGGDQNVENGDTLEVTYEISSVDDGV